MKTAREWHEHFDIHDRRPRVSEVLAMARAFVACEQQLARREQELAQLRTELALLTRERQRTLTPP